MIFLIATNNNNKKIEFKRILEPLGIEIKTAKELGIVFPDVEEDGTTFEANAIIKAKAGCELSGYPTLADDSGLCVDALDGAPGIFSARYASEDGENANDEANNDKLLRELEGVPDEKRTAQYVCAVAAVFPDGREFVVRGECKGVIGHERLGKGGFGYDPLFLVGDKTFAEVPPEVKDSQSHRSVALHKMSEVLKGEIN
ncbi:MAG: RdgB/HAM1 family non-canonical purine NTP pyrophosphatase [Clostridia bacterium]|nr:RdgB/HAM1 family non-canonical purine NTP pyrophosphatase [Clostridia bacterium]